MNTSSIMTIFFGELSSALGASPSSSPADAVGTYVELKPDSSLARLLDREEQHRKLSLVAEDILQTYLDHKVYNCSPAHVFLKQILANTVIDMTINSCSRPEWINDWIVYLLEEGEPELLKEVDAGLEGQTGDAVKNVEEEVAITDAKPNALKKSSKAQASHRRVVSRGQEAFDEAMQEAARLTRLMQEEDARLAEQRGTAVQHPLREPPNSAIEDSAALAAAGAMGMIDAGPMIPASNTNNANDDQSESTTQGIVTPTSSQSDRNHGSEGDSDRGISTESHRRDTGLPTSPSDNAPSSGFTSFDQIMPQAPPAAFGDNSEGSRQERDPLTLYNCNITIFDDSVPGDRAAIKTKPILDYLIQIEPASSQHPGWMIAKTYVDIEKLHESIRPLSKITGAGFDKTHTSVPGWKGQTKSQLREALERYLNDAVRSKQLAETEVMKRFFEKDQNLTKSPSGKVGINSAFETVGKGVTGGGKALIGGVAGVFGAMGPKRGSTSSSNPTGRTRSNAGSPSPHNRSESVLASTGPARQSADSLRRTTSNANPRQNSSSPIEGRPSITPEPDANARPRPVSPARSSILSQTSPPASRPSSIRESGEMSAAHGGDQIIHLPPLPSEIQDDYATSDITAAFSNDTDPIKSRAESILTASTAVDPFSETPLYDSKTPLSETPIDTQPPPLPKMPSKEYPPLTEKETQDAIELLFAVITELYTLSSAWSLRRTLLTAAKSFLLRPGNPQLESIRQLLQSTVLDANTSDAGMATHLRKLRENSLPTEAELAAWPKEPSEKEKEELRVKARKLLVERGMPVALTSVMGQAASGEALGRVFDCLQVKEVARGLMFGLMLQGIRVVVQ